MSRPRRQQLLRALLSAISLLASGVSARAASPWTPFGPGGGSVSSLAVDAGDPDRVYAVAGPRFLDPGTLYRSTDRGRTWEPLAGPGLSLVALDPERSSTICAGGLRLLCSVDGGETWSDVSPPAAGPFEMTALALAPGGVILAGALGNGGPQVLRSTDGGRTWKQVIGCDAGNGAVRAVQSLWTGARSPGPFYAVFNLASETGPGAAEAYRSWNGGATWKRLPFPGPLKLLAVAPGDPRVLYAYDFSKTLFRSADAGGSWQPVNGPLPQDLRLSGGLAVDATDADTVYVGTVQGVLVSHDGGRTLSPPLPPFEVDKKASLRLWTFHNQPGRVYAAGSDGGLFVGRSE